MLLAIRRVLNMVIACFSKVEEVVVNEVIEDVIDEAEDIGTEILSEEIKEVLTAKRGRKPGTKNKNTLNKIKAVKSKGKK